MKRRQRRGTETRTCRDWPSGSCTGGDLVRKVLLSDDMVIVQSSPAGSIIVSHSLQCIARIAVLDTVPDIPTNITHI